MPLAVIPWFELPSLTLGRITIQSFGVLSALGILAAAGLSQRAARQLGKDPQVVLDFAVVGVLAGVVGGHLVHLFFYHPEELEDPWRILMFWEGLSSMGGLLGGILAAIVWFRREADPAPRVPGRLRARHRAGLGSRAPRLLHRARPPRGPDRLPPRRPVPRRSAPRPRPLRGDPAPLARRGAVGPAPARAPARPAAPGCSRWSTASAGSCSTSCARATSPTRTRATSASPSRSTPRWPSSLWGAAGLARVRRGGFAAAAPR